MANLNCGATTQHMTMWKQWCDALGDPRLPDQGKDEHNALSDARWNKFAYDFLVGYSLPIRIRER